MFFRAASISTPTSHSPPPLSSFRPRAPTCRLLQWILEHKGVEDLYLTFSLTVPREDDEDGGGGTSGGALELPLKEGGADIDVTEENKREYVALAMRWTMLLAVQAELAAFMAGLFEVVPRDLLRVFDYQELELLLCGLSTIDVVDWKAHTDYEGVFSSKGAEHPVVQWFWEVVEAFSDEDRARLLQFATGTSRPPAQGFKALQSNDGFARVFALHGLNLPSEKLRAKRPACLWPKAHTCFNKVDLPNYDNKEQLERMLTLCINMEIGGFTIE